MDFAALPPEVNSARMYTGPGSGPMMSAAMAWNGLASDLYWTAANYRSTITGMTSGPWRGPASASMTAAAMPYVAWLESTAGQATQAATQAQAAAAAYEAAFAMTVPPPAIAANRALLAELVATNLLGQNTPAIAATEAEYGEMWAQDAAAMYGYAGSSAAASTVTPFTDPPAITSPEAATLAAAETATTSGTDAATQATLSQLVSGLPTALQGLAAPALTGTAAASGTDFMDWLGLGGSDLLTPGGLLSFLSGTDGSPLGSFLNSNLVNSIFSSGFYMPGNFLGTMTDFIGLGGGGAAGAAADAAGDAAGAAAGAAGEAAGAAAGGLGNAMGGLGSTVSAGVGTAAPIGPLSVPPTWTGTAPPVAATPLLPNPPMAAPPVGQGPASMLGGMPLSAPPGRGLNEVPRYGFRPTVVIHPPAAG